MYTDSKTHHLLEMLFITNTIISTLKWERGIHAKEAATEKFKRWAEYLIYIYIYCISYIVLRNSNIMTRRFYS